jgi:hypothetical protein
MQIGEEMVANRRDQVAAKAVAGIYCRMRWGEGISLRIVVRV